MHFDIFFRIYQDIQRFVITAVNQILEYIAFFTFPKFQYFKYINIFDILYTDILVDLIFPHIDFATFSIYQSVLQPIDILISILINIDIIISMY